MFPAAWAAGENWLKESQRKKMAETTTVHLYSAYKKSIWDVFAFHLNQMFLDFIFKQCLTLSEIFLERTFIIFCQAWWLVQTDNNFRKELTHVTKILNIASVTIMNL